MAPTITKVIFANSNKLSLSTSQQRPASCTSTSTWRCPRRSRRPTDIQITDSQLAAQLQDLQTHLALRQVSSNLRVFVKTCRTSLQDQMDRLVCSHPPIPATSLSRYWKKPLETTSPSSWMVSLKWTLVRNARMERVWWPRSTMGGLAATLTWRWYHWSASNSNIF